MSEDFILTGMSGTGLAANYVHDGDGNRIKSIVDGKTTYSIGNYYEKIDEKIGNEPSTTIKKYYYAGGARLAMSDNEGVRYFVTDHMGSTTKMMNTDGSEYSDSEEYLEIKFTSWGSDQPNTPDPGTSFKYTGQREAEAGLYYYNARWREAAQLRSVPGALYPPGYGRRGYKNEIGRFIQPDTIIPSPGNPLAWDRYARI